MLLMKKSCAEQQRLQDEVEGFQLWMKLLQVQMKTFFHAEPDQIFLNDRLNGVAFSSQRV